MFYVRWGFRLIFLLIFGAILHYTLPQRDIVRIVNTYEERQDFDGGWTELFWSGPSTAEGGRENRDVLFIQAVDAEGEPHVYRNEDTGWGWPPYFKFDTADLQTLAADQISTREEPKWVALRHYGWRSTWLSIFPNALSLKVVDGPDVTLVPWFNIVVLVIIFVVVGTIYRMLRIVGARLFGRSEP